VAEPDDAGAEAAQMGACLVVADLAVPGEPRHDHEQTRAEFGDLCA
jgi:hypothetical protein